MDKIKRPKVVEKQYKSIQTEEKFQENVKKELNTIYDKIDEIIEKINNM